MLPTKNTWPTSLLLVLATALLAAFRPGTPPRREVRELAPFTQLALACGATVELRQGSPQRVEIEADSGTLSNLTLLVRNGRLRITQNSPVSRHRHRYLGGGPVTIYLTMPRIEALSLESSGSLEARTPVQADELNLAVSSSGSLKLPEVQARTLNSALSGSGSLQLGGQCTLHQAALRGSGELAARALRSEDADVVLSGSGSARLWVSHQAKARVAGSGSVLVAGGAKISRVVQGSGQVVAE